MAEPFIPLVIVRTEFFNKGLYHSVLVIVTCGGVRLGSVIVVVVSILYVSKEPAAVVTFSYAVIVLTKSSDVDPSVQVEILLPLTIFPT